MTFGGIGLESSPIPSLDSPSIASLGSSNPADPSTSSRASGRPHPLPFWPLGLHRRLGHHPSLEDFDSGRPIPHDAKRDEEVGGFRKIGRSRSLERTKKPRHLAKYQVAGLNHLRARCAVIRSLPAE